MKRGRGIVLLASTAGYYLLFGGLSTYGILCLLPHPWDYIVGLIWVAIVLPQPVGYYYIGNGRQMDQHYIDTGEYTPGQWKG